MEMTKILLIDDNQDFVTLNCSMLELYGYQTVTAYSGLDGIVKARAHHPDVVICDIGLPDIDGYQVAGTLRNSADTKDCLLISLTGYAHFSHGEASKEAGFDIHLVKPVDIDALLQTISDAQSKSLKSSL